MRTLPRRRSCIWSSRAGGSTPCYRVLLRSFDGLANLGVLRARRPIAYGGRLSALRVAGRILGQRCLAMPFQVALVVSEKRTAVLREFQCYGAHGTTAQSGENEAAILDRPGQRPRHHPAPVVPHLFGRLPS